jgi:hypothetical protein
VEIRSVAAQAPERVAKHTVADPDREGFPAAGTVPALFCALSSSSNPYPRQAAKETPDSSQSIFALHILSANNPTSIVRQGQHRGTVDDAPPVLTRR